MGVSRTARRSTKPMHTTGARPEHVVYGPDYKQRGREKNRSSYHRLKAQKGIPEVLPVLPALCRIGTTTHSPEDASYHHQAHRRFCPSCPIYNTQGVKQISWRADLYDYRPEEFLKHLSLWVLQCNTKCARMNNKCQDKKTTKLFSLVYRAKVCYNER